MLDCWLDRLSRDRPHAWNGVGGPGRGRWGHGLARWRGSSCSGRVCLHPTDRGIKRSCGWSRSMGSLRLGRGKSGSHRSVRWWGRALPWLLRL